MENNQQTQEQLKENAKVIADKVGESSKVIASKIGENSKSAVGSFKKSLNNDGTKGPFANPGKSIKNIARLYYKICAVLTVIVAVGSALFTSVAGFIQAVDWGYMTIFFTALFSAVLMLIAGALTVLIIWIQSVVIYGLGELIENSTIIKNSLSK